MNITIDKLAERRLWALIRMTNNEVGGMGYAFLERDGSIHVREVFLTPQEVTSSEVDFESTNGDGAFVERAVADGVLEEPNFVPFSFHSHHTMKPFWSSTDDKRIAAMNAGGVKRLLSFVGCHDGTYRMRLDTFDFEAHGIYFPQVTLPDLSLMREVQEPDEFERAIKAEFEENVKEKKYEYTPYFTMGSTHTTGTNGNGKKSNKLSEQEQREDENRVVTDLIFECGYSREGAEETLGRLGVGGCEDLLDATYQNGRFA